MFVTNFGAQILLPMLNASAPYWNDQTLLLGQGSHTLHQLYTAHSLSRENEAFMLHGPVHFRLVSVSRCLPLLLLSSLREFSLVSVLLTPVVEVSQCKVFFTEIGDGQKVWFHDIHKSLN